MPTRTGSTSFGTALVLVPVAGPPAKPLTLASGNAVVIGRSKEADYVLADPIVSRRHCTIAKAGGKWLLTDLSSRHGTTINSTRIDGGKAVIIDEGDLIGIGAWTFHVGIGSSDLSFIHTTDDSSIAEEHLVRTVAPAELENMAQKRLQVLLDCAEDINAATDEKTLATEALKSALSGTGYQRAALMKPTGDERDMQIIGYLDDRGSDASKASFSRSLVKAASAGQLVRLTADARVTGQSIVDLNITQAICAPVMIGKTVVAYLYLDVRDRSAPIQGDAAAFSQAIARLCGFAMSNIKHVDLERRQLIIEGELDAARQAQKLIMPAEQATVVCARYALRTHPGSFVAGDLFDVLKLDDNRVAISIGDVAGEGAGAAVIMAAAQSHLNGALRTFDDPAKAVGEVNRYISERSAANRFISMWVGVFDRREGVLRYVDAGHGHWMHKPTDGPAVIVEHKGGLVVGIEGSFVYEAEDLVIKPGDRIVLFSDGVIEQQSPEGEFFGNDRLLDIINKSKDEVADVETALAAVKKFAGGAALADDTTVASVTYQP